jgi:glycosyltransferase involved in cell wall biosynthesis
VLGAAAAWADVGNIESLAAAISSVLDNESVATDIVAAGLDRLACFSWDTTVDSLADLYRRAVEDR